MKTNLEERYNTDNKRMEFFSQANQDIQIREIILLLIESSLIDNNDVKKILKEEYAGRNPEFDFLVFPDKFDESKFDINWITGYSKMAYEHFNNNLKQKEFIISKLKNFSNFESLNNEQIKRLFYVYKFMTN